NSSRLRRTRSVRRGQESLRLLEALELGRDRLDTGGDLPALCDPFALLTLERRELVEQGAGILSLQAAIRVGEPPLERVALLFQLRGPAAKLRDEAGGARPARP